jgi:hypothetical protein
VKKRYGCQQLLVIRLRCSSVSLSSPVRTAWNGPCVARKVREGISALCGGRTGAPTGRLPSGSQRGRWRGASRAACLSRASSLPQRALWYNLKPPPVDRSAPQLQLTSKAHLPPPPQPGLVRFTCTQAARHNDLIRCGCWRSLPPVELPGGPATWTTAFGGAPWSARRERRSRWTRSPSFEIARPNSRWRESES